MNGRRVLERLVDEVVEQRAMNGDSSIRGFIERGDPKWMPGYLIRKLSGEELEAISRLSSDDFMSMRIDPWQV